MVHRFEKLILSPGFKLESVEKNRKGEYVYTIREEKVLEDKIDSIRKELEVLQGVNAISRLGYERLKEKIEK